MTHEIQRSGKRPMSPASQPTSRAKKVFPQWWEGAVPASLGSSNYMVSPNIPAGVNYPMAMLFSAAEAQELLPALFYLFRKTSLSLSKERDRLSPLCPPHSHEEESRVTGFPSPLQPPCLLPVAPSNRASSCSKRQTDWMGERRSGHRWSRNVCGRGWFLGLHVCA